MTKLKILDWGKIEREVDFVGYNSDHTICYIYDENHTKRALILKLPHRCGLRFAQNPIPNFPPTSITRAALRLPTCFASKAELDASFQPPANWPPNPKAVPLHEQLEFVNPHKAWIEPKQEKQLAKMLVEEQQRLRRKYEARQREIAEYPTFRREKELRALAEEFTTKVQCDSLGSSRRVSVFDVALEDAKHGALGLREKLIHKEFAEAHGFGLATIPQEARRFRHWVARSVVCVTHLDDVRWQLLEMLVRYEIAFHDGARCWLDEIKETELTDPQQVEEFDRLEAAAEVAGNEQMSLDEVCRALIVKRKGESKPMTTKGLGKICEKAHIPFKFPMRRSVFRRLEAHRQRQARKKSDRIRRRNRQEGD
jgi:hypothetical protein